MKTNIAAKFNNEYLLQIRDSKTKQIKQEVKTHNIALDNFWSFYALTDAYRGTQANARFVQVGCGEGTPAATDTSLFNALWTAEGNATCVTSADGKTIETTIVVTFPATTSYVADITEVGILVDIDRPCLITHALLQDAEGNPIKMHKGDLDELIVTAIIRFTMEGDGFVLFPFDRTLLGSFFIPGRNGGDLCNCSLTVQRSHRGISKLDRTASLAFSPSPTYNLSTHKFTLTNGRITANNGNVHYYNSLVLSDFGYWPLPNPDIFPYYLIENIPIGIGDGITTDFDNPLNYFVKNSEQITKNGVLLTRDVDYTIDYHNNKDMLTEISEALQAHMYNDLVDRTTSNQPFFVPCDSNGSGLYNDTAGNGLVNRLGKNAPIFLQFDEPTTINTIRIASLCVNWQYNSISTRDNNCENAVFKFSSSDDGEIYTEILTTEAFNAYTGKAFNFPDIKAKHFKIEIIGGKYFNNSNYYYVAPPSYYPTCNDCFIGRVGDPYIKFTTPPEEGAELKMTVQMDRPFKNDRFVIDFTGEIQLS